MFFFLFIMYQTNYIHTFFFFIVLHFFFVLYIFDGFIIKNNKLLKLLNCFFKKLEYFKRFYTQ